MTTKTPVLIVDHSAAYVGFCADLVVADWGGADHHLVTVADLPLVGMDTFFSAAPSVRIMVSCAEDIKAVVGWMSSASAETLSCGVIVGCTASRTFTRKLENLFASRSWVSKVSDPKKKRRGAVTPLSVMLDTVHVSPALRRFLVDYAAEDYDLLIPAVRNIAVLPPKAQAGLTVSDMEMRLPCLPGAVPPWAVLDAVLAGDVGTLASAYQRVCAHGSPLVVIAVVRNRLVTAWRAAVLRKVYPQVSWTHERVAATLGVPDSFPLRKACEDARRFPVRALRGAVERMTEVERLVKGGSRADPVSVTLLGLVSVSEMLHEREQR